MRDEDMVPMARWSLAWLQASLWRLILSAGLAVVFAILALRNTAEDPQKNYAVSRAALVAMEPKALAKADNAAVDYRGAFAAIVPFAGASELDPAGNLSRGSAFFDDPAVQAHLAANAAAITALEAATGKERANWNADYSLGFRARLPNLLSMRNAAMLLGVRARVRAHKGDHAGAALDLRRMQIVGRHMSTDPFLICGMVDTGICGSAGEAMQAILLFDTPVNAADIDAYLRAFDDAPNPYTEFGRLFDFESAIQAYTIDMAALSTEETQKLFGNSQTSALVTLQLMLCYGTERKSQRALQDEMRIVAREERPVPDNSEMLTRTLKGPAPLTGMFRPNIMRSQNAVLEWSETKRCFDAALAVLRFRAAKGRDPKSLDELVPEFFSRVPVDWISKKPLRVLASEAETEFYAGGLGETAYRKWPPGVLRIYTVGRNGRDDRGRGSSVIEKTTWDWQECDDVVVFLPPFKKSDK